MPPAARAYMELARGTSDENAYRHYVNTAVQLCGGRSFLDEDEPLMVTRLCVICGHEWKRALA
jgi:hypothetical protein